MDLGLPPVKLLGYPLSMVLAEKIITAIDRGLANTRWRDFADVYTLTRIHAVQADTLRASLDAVAKYRKVPLTPLLPALTPMKERSQRKYQAWYIRSSREDELPEEFADVLAAVANFSDPTLSTTATGEWNPRLQTWT